jgi:serine/threonine protein kinase
MRVEQWRRVSQLFEAVLERPEHERRAFIATECEGDDALRRELESLLGQEDRDGPLDHPVYVAGDLMPEENALTEGAIVGVYRVEGTLGSGGMGEVYRARDTKLGRCVALKVLPSRFAADPERLARFQREAQTLAALNDSHIGAIYGIEEDGAVRALVLELVEGDTLEDRISRSPLHIDEALPIARQIVDALQAAHDRGVIHRDLKPSNIKISPDGSVKVLDFGLARLTQQDAVDQTDATLSPTSPAVVTAAGMILGTAAYMAPEQAKGRLADTRSDIWGFGCVLFEMLTGRRAFAGEEVAETLAVVLRGEPDWTVLPPDTPASVAGLLRKCLTKNPRERLQHIGDARFDLSAADGPSTSRRPSTTRWRERFSWAVAAIALAALVVVASRGAAPSALEPETHVEILATATTDPASLAISSDGRTVVYLAGDDRVQSLWIRSLDQAAARQLPNTQGASNPFWSPDGRSIGFFADQALKRIDVETGTVQTLVRTSGNNRGGAWNRDNVIVFVPTSGYPMQRIPAAGGEATRVFNMRAGAPSTPLRVSLAFPHFLPDDQHVLCLGQDERGRTGIYLFDLGGSSFKRLFDSDSAAVVMGNEILFVRSGSLLAQRFDAARPDAPGNPYRIADRMFVNREGKAALTASAQGSLVYRNDVPEERRQLTWIDRTGRRAGTVGDSHTTSVSLNPSLSPDEKRLAVSLATPGTSGNREIWVFDLARGIGNRLTDNSGADGTPVWLPGSQAIIFGRDARTLLKKAATTISAPEEIIARTGPRDRAAVASDVSRDGRYILLRFPDQRNGFDIRARDLRRQAERSFPVVETQFDELDAQFSPDGRWIAYQSNKTGRFEIYLQPFPESGNRDIRVSTNGGVQVRWRADGTELFYVTLDGTLMVAPIRFQQASNIVDAGPPVALFPANLGNVLAFGGGRQQYVVSSDGQRFLMNALVPSPASAPIKLILNRVPGPR